MARYYNYPFWEAPEKAISSYSPYELAQVLYTREELGTNGQRVPEVGLFSHDIILTQDFRALPGFQVQLKNLGTLSLLKKNHG